MHLPFPLCLLSASSIHLDLGRDERYMCALSAILNFAPTFTPWKPDNKPQEPLGSGASGFLHPLGMSLGRFLKVRLLSWGRSGCMSSIYNWVKMHKQECLESTCCQGQGYARENGRETVGTHVPRRLALWLSAQRANSSVYIQGRCISWPSRATQAPCAIA